VRASRLEKFVDAYRTAKIVIANRVRHFDVPSEPHFEEEGTAYFRKQIESARNYLEYGSGWARRSSQVGRVKHARERRQAMGASSRMCARKLAEEEGRKAMTKLIHVNIGLTYGWGHACVYETHAAPCSPLGGLPDSAPGAITAQLRSNRNLILVDGRFSGRVACWRAC